MYKCILSSFSPYFTLYFKISKVYQIQSFKFGLHGGKMAPIQVNLWHHLYVI